MSSYPIAMFLFASAVWAQDKGAAPPEKAAPQTTQPPADASLVRKLEAVTWNPTEHELSWVVSIWDVSSSSEQPVAKQDYKLQLDSATMNFKGEKRGFDTEEARQVRMLMDIISAYAVGSTVWWERVQTEDPECPVKPGQTGEDQDKSKDEKPKASPRPAAVVLPGPIAAAHPLPQTTRPAASWH